MGAVAEPRHALLGDGVRGGRGPAAEQLRSDRGSLDTEGVLYYQSLLRVPLLLSTHFQFCLEIFPVESPVAWQLQFSKQVRKCHKTLHLSFTFPVMPKEGPDGPDLTYDRFIKILNKRVRRGCIYPCPSIMYKSCTLHHA